MQRKVQTELMKPESIHTAGENPPFQEQKSKLSCQIKTDRKKNIKLFPATIWYSHEIWKKNFSGNYMKIARPSGIKPERNFKRCWFFYNFSFVFSLFFQRKTPLKLGVTKQIISPVKLLSVFILNQGTVICIEPVKKQKVSIPCRKNWMAF